MSDDPEDDIPVDSTEPIDADFEPAFEDQKTMHASKTGAGPGWLGLGVASLVAAGIGGAIGIVATMALPGKSADGDVSALTAELDALKAEQVTADVERNKVIRNSADLEARLDARLKSVAAAGGDDLGPLLEELDAVSKRIDEVIASDDGGEAVAKLSARLEALEAVDTSGEASAQELARSVGALAERVTSLETRLADLQSDIVRSGGDTTELTSLIERMRNDEAAVRAKAEVSESNADAALALSAIEAASRQGLTFESDYRKLRVLLPQSAEVRSLSGVATTGAPTLADLQRSFGPASAKARAAEPREKEGRWGWLNHVFGDAVTVRGENAEEAGAPVILSRAKDALDSGDLEGAVAIIGNLTGEPAAAMADWTESANRRITLETGLKALRLGMIGGENQAQ
ncbi:COG4223 family protein [Hyphomonas chukchiensis]|uniref:Mitochondrial inner membrane protein n=1 Tax=Hyphomonas chukchiensis TaxID=1280947 RepID=A0A062USL8_9PROT|nr:hypothetical protein [Hyphomonas chukchiensis]KCZ61221.1 hypothetical protein HY30_02450 [Hyphomonas chukchiensis]